MRQWFAPRIPVESGCLIHYRTVISEERFSRRGELREPLTSPRAPNIFSCAAPSLTPV
jgi:hypothetical protein